MCTSSSRLTFLGLVGAAALVLVGAGLSGCGGSGGLTGGQAAPGLPEFDENNTYAPNYVTGDMKTPRYLHDAIKLTSGLVLVAGGSDENGFSTIDTIELFDQSTLQRDEVEPESLTGTWFDTDFAGDPMVLQIGRVFHTISELPDNNVIVIGGAPNLNQAFPLPEAEVFDQLTRTVEVLEDGMVDARFRHTSTVLDDGRILVAGGQVHTVFTESQNVIVVGGGGGGGGNQQVQIQRDIFPSVRTNEFFSVIDRDFKPLTLPGTTRDALLTPSRGRSGHTTTKFAGPDNRLNTGDDLTLLVGGYQTLSGENAPQIKFPGLGQGGLAQMEFFDPVVGVFTEVPLVRLNATRVNHPQATHLGVFNETTIDGVSGMGNAILVCNGDNDAPLGARVSNELDEVYIATFTGFGPAQGLQFFKQDSPFQEHIQGIEAALALGGLFEAGPPPPGRTTTNIVTLPHRIPSVAENNIQTWVYNGGGAHVYVVMGVQITYFGGSISSGVLFDPYFSLTAVADFDSSPRDLRPGRRNRGNPVGIIGTWLAVDGFIPDNSLDGFGDTPFQSYAALRAGQRFWTKVVNVAGEDGVDNTLDDRILFIGGGRSVFDPGGDPSFPSAEILLVPGTGSDR